MSYLGEEIEEEIELEKEIEETGQSSKVLFIGLTQSGKTSIIHVVFSGWNPSDTKEIPTTIDFSKQVKQFHDMNIFIYDIGGQTYFLEQALKTSKSLLFSEVSALFFVVDVTNLWAYQKAREYFLWSLRNAREMSNKVKISVLAHKIDLIPEEDREIAISQLSEALNLSEIQDVKIYGTSIYDNSISRLVEEILLSKE